MSQSLSSQRAAQWRAVLNRQQSSGFGIAEFCRREVVPVSTFHWWRRKLGAVASPSPRPSVDWVEAQALPVPLYSEGPAVRIGNADGLWIEFAASPGPDLLRAALHALNALKGGAPC